MAIHPTTPSLFGPAPTDAIACDRRRIGYTPRPDLISKAARLVRELRDVELALGETLAEIEQHRAHLDVCAATVERLATRFGLAPEEARRYRDLGRAMAVQPSVKERVAARALPTTRAALLAPVLDGTGEPDSDLERELGMLPEWIRTAERTGTGALRRLVRREMTMRRTGEAVVDLTFHATETAREHFERARVLASRAAQRRLSNDETFRVVVEDYVERHDPLLSEDGTRRVPDTSERPGERYVPASVRRAVRRRAGDRCEHPECDERTFLEFAHRVAHADGGDREEDNLFLLCWLHHTLLDAGALRPTGPTADAAWPQIVVGGGYVYTRRHPGGREPQTDEERRVLAEMLAEQRRQGRAGENDQEARGPP